MEVTAIVTTVGGPWLADQLAALADQIRPPDQLVLVNNGPAGAVDEVVEAWRTKLPGLELVEDRSMAVCGHARNVGAARAQHPGLLFLDDDDVVSEGYVAAMAEALDDAEMVAARIDLDQLNSPGLASRWGVMQHDEPMTYHGFLPWVIGGAFGVRRDTFTQLGGFDTDMRVGEDTDLCWRAQLDGGARIAFVPGATLSYRLRTRPGPAFRQSRLWASWEPALYKRYRPRGLGSPGNQFRALLRWGRPFLLLVRARRSDDLVVALRQLGACVGRLEGSIRHRHLRL
jgi:GT2 family glycosyltransferase